MEISVALGILSGLVATILTAIINQPTWTPERKRTVSLIVATFWAIVAAIASGVIVGIPPDVSDWVVRIVIMLAGVVISAQGLYAQFKDILKKLELNTTPVGRRYAPDDAPPEAF